MRPMTIFFVLLLAQLSVAIDLQAPSFQPVEPSPAPDHSPTYLEDAADVFGPIGPSIEATAEGILAIADDVPLAPSVEGILEDPQATPDNAFVVPQPSASVEPALEEPFASPDVIDDPFSNLNPTQTPISGTGTPSPLPPTPPAGTDFPSLTFRRAVRNSDRFSVPDPANPDATLRVSVNATLRAAGVVSLSAAKPFVRNVTCRPDGTVRIELTDSAPVDDVARMYPVGAVLAIDRSLYGECVVAPRRAPADDEDEEASRDRRIDDELSDSSQFEDTFVEIQSVSGSPRDAVVSGKPTFYFAMFEELFLTVTRDEGAARPVQIRTNAGTERMIATNNGESGRNAVVLPANSARQLVLTRTRKYDLTDKAELTSTTTLSVRSAFRDMTLSYSFGKLDAEATLVNDFQIEQTVGLSVDIGSSSKDFVREIGRWPIYGVQGLKVLGKASKNDKSGFSLPDLKTGVFFELALVAYFDASTDFSLGATGGLKYDSGRAELVISATGVLPFISIDSRTRRLSGSSFTPTFTPDLPTATNPGEVSLTAFLGVRPRVALYVPFIEANVAVDLGVELTARTNVPLSVAYPPVRAGPTFGVCDTCHHLQLDASAKLQKASLSAALVCGFEFCSKNGTNVELAKYESELPGEPSLSQKLVTACAIEQFEGNAEVCGDTCCDERTDSSCVRGAPGTEPTCDGSPSPTPHATPSVSPSVSPSPGPEEEEGAEAACFTDPHLRTFDGLAFDCQAIGEFVLAKSAGGEFEVQARFSGPNTRGTVTKGIAIRMKGRPTIQVSISSPNVTGAAQINNCAVATYVNEKMVDIRTASDMLTGASISLSLSNIAIRYSGGPSVSVRVTPDATFGCFLESLDVFLPRSLLAAGDVRGLLGTPNQNPDDDWTERSGKKLAPPKTSEDALFEKAYNYCTNNWCVRDEGESLFTYEAGSSFATFNKCDRPYDGQLDLSSASAAVRAVCDDDAACLVDGIAGGEAAALRALTVQASVDERLARRSTFRFEPPVIAVGAPVNVMITLDVSGRANALLAGLDSFALYRVDTATGAVGAARLATLRDDGGAISSDSVADDRVFTNVLALQSARGGEVFRFRAVPVVGGSEQPTSALAATAVVGVRSVRNGTVATSVPGPSGTTGRNGTTVSVPSLDGLELVAYYSWPLDQDDLDTATTFLGNTAGFGCFSGGSSYLTWDGDVLDEGGTEAVAVNLDQARKDGEWSGSTVVRFACGWFSSGSGPATLRLLLRESASEKVVNGTAITVAVVPGVQRGCASTAVAELMVDVTDRARLTLKTLS